jgi:hypothetical protein
MKKRKAAYLHFRFLSVLRFFFNSIEFVREEQDSNARLINHHSTGYRASHIRGQLGGLLRLLARLSFVDMGLQTLVEIVHAHASVDDSHDDESNRDDSKERE